MTLSPAQMKLRETIVTASQVSTVLGFNPFSTPQELAHRKMNGMVDEDRPIEDGKMDVRDRGHVLERPTAEGVFEMLGFDKGHLWTPRQVFAELKLDARIIDDTLFHKNRKWLAATIDFIHFDGKEIKSPVEVKSSSITSGWSGGQVPRHVACQCQVQMLVLNSHGFNVKRTLVAGCISSNIMYRWVEFDPQAIEPHLEQLYNFQRACNRKDSNYFVPRKAKKQHTPFGSLTREEQGAIDLYLRYKQEQKDVAKKIKDVSPRVQGILIGHDGVSIPGRGKLIFSKPSKSVGMDTEGLLGAFEGKLIELGLEDFTSQCRRDFVKATGRRGHLKLSAARRKK